jgi:hypothetical protein
VLAVDEDRLGEQLDRCCDGAAIAVAEFPRCVAFSRDGKEKGSLNRP